MVASKILNEDIEKNNNIISNHHVEVINTIPDNAIQTLTIDYRETNN